MDVHPGLIVLRQSGLSRDEKWANLLSVIEHIKISGDGNFLLNKLVEISSPGHGDMHLTPFDTNWKKGGGATPLTTQDL